MPWRALPTPQWSHLKVLAVERSLSPASQAVDFTAQEEARQGAGRRCAGVNDQLFFLSSYICITIISLKKGHLPHPLPSSTMGREGSRGNRAFESEPTQLWGKPSSSQHGPAPALGCRWEPGKGRTKTLGSEGQVPPNLRVVLKMLQGSIHVRPPRPGSGPHIVSAQ